ncbi:MAG: hypothetical protein R6U19_08130 [Bacteroidales bacterium]
MVGFAYAWLYMEVFPGGGEEDCISVWIGGKEDYIGNYKGSIWIVQQHRSVLKN